MGQYIWVSLSMIVPKRIHICNPRQSWDDGHLEGNDCYPVMFLFCFAFLTSLCFTYYDMGLNSNYNTENLETLTNHQNSLRLILHDCALRITLSALPTLQSFMRIKCDTGKLESALQIYITFYSISETSKVGYKVIHYLTPN